MESANILDANTPQRHPLAVRDTIIWWEKKRLLYNLLLVAVEAAIMLLFSRGTQNFGIENALLQSTYYTLVANALYTSGWAAELLVAYCSKGGGFIRTFRKALLLMGVALSVGLTIWWYSETLVVYQH